MLLTHLSFLISDNMNEPNKVTEANTPINSEISIVQV